MFHVFYLNEGLMIVLEPTLFRLVLDLQKSIQLKTNVDVQEQALFLSNGETISSTASLSSYLSVATEENPIYMVRRVSNFNKDNFTIADQGENIKLAYENWYNNIKRIEKNEKINVTHQINDCAKLGKHGMEIANEMFKVCNKFVIEHQHIKKCWEAMIKCLDHTAESLQRRMDRLAIEAKNFQIMREKGMELLDNFDSVLDILSQIIIPYQLLSSSPSISVNTEAEKDMSLYDFISSKDSTYLLNDLVDYMKDHLKKTDDIDLQNAKTSFESVYHLLLKPEYREIGGMTKRIETLEKRILDFEKKRITLNELAKQIIQPSLDTSLNNILIYQKNKLSEFTNILFQTYKLVLSFSVSKKEVLQNITQRLFAWLQKTFANFNQSNKSMVLFDEKCKGICQRLNMVRQIKEAPTIYFTAVAEVIRRENLKKDFLNWLSVFIEKSKKFIVEENNTRIQFFSKLEKHFLRSIFYGMSDLLPNFCPTDVKFDQNLPKVSVLHLKELEWKFSHMKEFLKVPQKQVYNMLFVPDPNVLTQSLTTQQTNNPQIYNNLSSQTTKNNYENTLKQEDLYFLSEQTTNITTINKNFMSNNWLSDEHINMSLTNNLFSTSKPAFSASSSSLHIDTQLIHSPMELGPLSEFNDQNSAVNDFSSLSAKQKSSTLPLLKTSSVKILNALYSTSSETIMNESSSTIREENFTTNFMSNDLNEFENKKDINCFLQGSKNFSNQSLIINKVFKVNCIEINTKVKNIIEFFSELQNFVHHFIFEMQKELKNNLTKIKTVMFEINQKQNVEINKFKKRIEDFSKMFDEFKKNSEKEKIDAISNLKREKFLREEKEKELDEQKQIIEKLNNELLALLKTKDELHVDLLKIEQERAQLKQQLKFDNSFDYFSIEIKTLEQFLNRSLTDAELNELKKNAEKRRTEKMIESATSLVSTSSDGNMNQNFAVNELVIRNEYEKFFRKKMEFIIKGVENRKNKEMMLMQEESKNHIKKLEQKIKELENHIAINDNDKKINLSSQTPENFTIENSCVVLNKTIFDLKNKCENLAVKNFKSFLKIEEEDCKNTSPCVTENYEKFEINKNEKAIQTRIKKHDMHYMITLKNIHEGCAVLVMWNAIHNAYIVFCTSSTLYFVKENCLEKLNQGNCRNWLFVIVENIEKCQIKKDLNRYNLPLNTKFNRITVKPLLLDVISFPLTVPFLSQSLTEESTYQSVISSNTCSKNFSTLLQSNLNDKKEVKDAKD